jgi:GR25 family glycosyltransferase involved in LPS biosynthesis
MINSVKTIFVVHYKQLIDRKKYITDYFKKNGITNYEFRDYYQRENITKETMDKYSDTNDLPVVFKCVAIEHIEIYKEIVNRYDDDDWCLIVEDDAIFCENFPSVFGAYMENKPSDAEYLDLSDYYTVETDLLWYKHNTTKTVCGYVIKKSTCKKILSTIIPLRIPIDHEMNNQIQIHNLNMYWSGKPLIHHGSSPDLTNNYIKSY